ncbi:MAG: LCP family protein [Candidatus Kerfeldbacteria bacterium]|nr:LCP family protein [Candidatus Kerfeldbacteria bacterium]
MPKRTTPRVTKLSSKKNTKEQTPITDQDRDISEYTLVEEAIVNEPPIINAPTVEEVAEQPTPQRKRHWVRWSIFAALLLFICGGAAYGYSLYSIITHSITNKDSQHSAIEQIARIIAPNIQKVNGEEDDRINILLLGKGGANYPGGTLTDTIMVASVQPSTKKVTLISIPRDLVVPIPPENLATADYLKINSVLVHGDIEMEKKIITMLTGLEVHYYAEIDFDGFTDVIDAVGGIEVNVERAFTGHYGVDQLESPCPALNTDLLDDGYYCRVTFSAGEQHMDGYIALMYARIRKVPLGYDQTEAGDFARAARQQDVIQAFKEKIFTVGTLLNPTAITNILTAVGKHATTDMEVWEMLRIGDLVKEVKQDDIVNVILDADSEESVLINEHSTTTGAFYLEPRAGLADYSEIQAVIQAAINPVVEETIHDTDSATQTNEGTWVSLSATRIVVQNGAGITGLAGTAQTRLEALGMTNVAIGNAIDRTQTTTRIYDLSNGEVSAALTALETLLGVTSTPATLPTSTTIRSSTDLNPNIVDTSILDETTDIVVILGKDQQHLAQ